MVANDGKSPRVLDPFAGGGAIPLEALRLGCETYAWDYNPVAALLLKCTLQYAQRYSTATKGSTLGLADKGHNQLVGDVKRWSAWILEEARKELERFYPPERDGAVTVGYIWARTIPCQNPSCGAVIPLFRQYWLARKGDARVSLYPYVSGAEVAFRLVGRGHGSIPKDFDPAKGSVSKAIATCLVCGTVVDGKSTKAVFSRGESSQKLIAVVLKSQTVAGKQFRIANNEDLQNFTDAESYLHEKERSLVTEWGFNPVPDEPTPEGRGRGAERAFSIRSYQMTRWGDLYNSRQKLALVSFTEKVKACHRQMLDEGLEREYAKAVMSYLALALDKLVASCSVLCTWKPDTIQVTPALAGNSRQTFPIIWDYVELNPISGVSRSWLNLVIVMLDSFRLLIDTAGQASVGQSSSTALPFAENYFDAVFTDPPYYDNVPYSYLSDFFYVWLKRSIGDLYPDLFATPLTPKRDEIVAYSYGDGGFEEGKKFFETMLKKAFSEMHRVIKPGGVAVIVYAHKSTSGWETLVNSLLDSGLVVTSAWPIQTEMKMRLRAVESAALSSSIYMVARKVRREATGFYKDVKDTLTIHLQRKLDKLWNEGISGADFFIAAIGSSIEVFGKFQKIIDDEGSVLRADKLLEDVRKIVTNYAVKQVLHDGIAGEISPMARFYVLWRWAYGDARLEFDDADKLAKGVGIDLAHEWNRSFIQKEKEFVRVLGPDDREKSELSGSKELVDVLHGVLLLWKQGKNEEVLEVLKETGFGVNDVFYKVAQAISESLPSNNKEKKLLEGFLQGKHRIEADIKEQSKQTRLPL